MLYTSASRNTVRCCINVKYTSWPQCVYRRNPAQKVKFPTCFGMCWTTGPRISPNYKHAPINPIHKHTWDPSPPPPPPSTGLADPPPNTGTVTTTTALPWPPDLCPYGTTMSFPLLPELATPAFLFYASTVCVACSRSYPFFTAPPPFHPPRSEAKPCKHSSVIYFIG